MNARARVDSESPRRIITAIRRLVTESERSAEVAVQALRAELEDVRRELGARERRLGEARARLVRAQAALDRCLATPDADCSGAAREVERAMAEVRHQERRVGIAREVVGEMSKQHDRAVSARGRLLARQQGDADAAWRALSSAAGMLDAYLSGGPSSAGSSASLPGVATAGRSEGGASSGTGSVNPSPAGGPGSVAGSKGASFAFSNDAVAQCWSLGISTPAGRAYYAEGDATMRGFAVSLKPFQGEYAVDLHGSPSSVTVGDQRLGGGELAELVGADPDWQGRPVRLFACEAGRGTEPIAQKLADGLGVRVTAPKAPAWSNLAGDSWVAHHEWKIVGGTLQRGSGPPEPGGWRSFDPRDSRGRA